MLLASLSRPPPLPPSPPTISPPNPFLQLTSPRHLLYRNCWRTRKRRLHHQGGSRRVCRSALVQDAPIAVAIGACILNSLVFPVYPEKEDDGGGGTIDSTDMRLAVMGIISFIPYFDWMSWVFAWLDSGRQRYIVYSIVYLAPYLRTNLSLSPEESWLPIASIALCIVHVQLEISIMNGDLSSILLVDMVKKFSPKGSIKDGHSHDHRTTNRERKKDMTKLPSARDKSRNDLNEWTIPGKPLERDHKLHETEDAEGRRKSDW